LLEEAAREPEGGLLGSPADVFLVGAEAGINLPLEVDELEGVNDFTTALEEKFEERGKVSASAHVSWACAHKRTIIDKRWREETLLW
jgi:hypothetical protein